MNILLLANKRDLKRDFMGNSLLDHLAKQFNKNKNNFKIFSKYREVRSKVDNKILLDSGSLSEGLELFKKDKEYFTLITKLAISNISYEKFDLYHSNHDLECSIILRNLVKGKTTPVYRLDEKKRAICVNKKRYASCGVYCFDSTVDFSNMNTLASLIEDKIKERQVKSFVHTGYYERKPSKDLDNLEKKSKKHF